MNRQLDLDRELLANFLRVWHLKRVANMSLREYVGLNDRNTFCYWVETETKTLGSINGVASNKFEIFECGKENPQYKRLKFDGKYAWNSNKYGNTRTKAFKGAKESIRTQIENIINYAGRNELEEIEKIPIHGFLKWKVAFLYSKEGFIPIFCRADLGKIAEQLGMTVTKKTPTCDIHRFVFSTFSGESVWDYMRELYRMYRTGGKRIEGQTGCEDRGRLSTDHKNTNPYSKEGTLGGIVHQHHNEMQNKLKDKLNIIYPGAVFMEKDFVDISIELDGRKLLYEVKSHSSPSRCIREALGQLFQYAHKDKSDKTIEFIVYGRNKPSDIDEIFIKYIQSCLVNVTFRYESEY